VPISAKVAIVVVGLQVFLENIFVVEILITELAKIRRILNQYLVFSKYIFKTIPRRRDGRKQYSRHHHSHLSFCGVQSHLLCIESAPLAKQFCAQDKYRFFQILKN
jgi:hypothetical protein